MGEEETILQKRIDSGKPVLIAEISPPADGDPAPLRAVARRFAGRVHALGVCDNRQGVCMSALAAASLLRCEGVEPILQITTRDRNRIALVSDCLGAQALGIRNLLSTSGTHPSLGRFRCARGVFDIDPIQLLQTIDGLRTDGSLVGQSGFEHVGPFCLGAAADPCADPLEMQVSRLAKKVSAGARFLITQPVFDLERFDLWFKEVSRRGIHEQAAVLVGIEPLTDAASAGARAAERPSPMIPDALLEQITSQDGKHAQRAAGIQIARQCIERLSAMSGLRGFAIREDGSGAAEEVIEKSGLGTD